ncbi:DsbA family oxidoreductase [Phytomonospora endophytica]|uniref:Putative DsbA family dithiol-disulfide isomerase n=1 Tax=Phytomonospora endophytica TaxID=714109 RepID=A0A841FXD4_9ACTN|nr:DsbA family oxidoreductase [Phytomonospora endophytica]MBB6037129.1 putative DsbA family dithiol-disulfide isomerase [Phytomonospora endophytica]GIG71169.1 DSBA oxidoreductase [Phytomonospora endophytica]
MSEIHVEIWSDLLCPWCFIGKRRFEAALAAFEHRDDVRVTWRSFELDPGRGTGPELNIPQHISRDLGLPQPEADRVADKVTRLAAEVGLTYRLERARPVNSFDAHRLMHHGEAEGLGEPLRERLMTAYTAEGADLSDHELLAALAAEAGLDQDGAMAVLASRAYGEQVRADERRARDLGVTGVPTFVFAERLATSGAQTVEVFADLLTRARNG